MITRIPGILIFLPVPLVLFLFTNAPLGLSRQGLLTSTGLGVAVMLTHRLYARRYALARARRRCLWTGQAVDSGPLLVIEEPMGPTTWTASDGKRAVRLKRLFSWSWHHRLFIRIGILGTLALFLLLVLLIAFDRSGPIAHADAVAFFRIGIAVTVLPVGWLAAYRGDKDATPIKAPFPVHIQALIGSWSVLWLFRLIGIVWLALGLHHMALRLNLL